MRRIYVGAHTSPCGPQVNGHDDPHSGPASPPSMASRSEAEAIETVPKDAQPVEGKRA